MRVEPSIAMILAVTLNLDVSNRYGEMIGNPIEAINLNHGFHRVLKSASVISVFHGLVGCDNILMALFGGLPRPPFFHGMKPRRFLWSALDFTRQSAQRCFVGAGLFPHCRQSPRADFFSAHLNCRLIISMKNTR